MKAMTRYSKSTVSIPVFLGIVALILFTLTISGCGHKTTLSEASTFLQAQVQQTEINSYKLQMQATKTRLTEVIPEVADPNPVLPPSLLGKLTTFLVEHDCTQLPAKEDKDQCYKLTRFQLIETVKAYDSLNVDNYAAKKTINQLILNINTIVDGLTDPGDPQQTTTKGPVAPTGP